MFGASIRICSALASLGCLGGGIRARLCMEVFLLFCVVQFSFLFRNRRHYEDEERTHEEELERLSWGLAGGHEDFFNPVWLVLLFGPFCNGLVFRGESLSFSPFPFAPSSLLLVLSVNVFACLRRCCASQHKQ